MSRLLATASGGLLAFWLLFVPTRSGAADLSELERQFAGVKEWSGTLTVTEQASMANDCDGWMRDFSRTLENRSVTKFRLLRRPDPRKNAAGVFDWHGDGRVSASNDLQMSQHDMEGAGISLSQQSAGELLVTGIRLQLDLRNGRAGFWNGSSEQTLPRTRTGERIERETDAGHNVILVSLPIDESDTESRWAKARFDPELDWRPVTPSPLSFSDERKVDEIASWAGTSCERHSKEGRLVTARAHLWLTPAPEELELVVRIEGTRLSGEQVSYADWLPEGIGIPYQDPKPGSRLQLNARLQALDGRPATVELERVRFELHDTSHEPAVAMNWPAPSLPGDHEGPIAPDRQPDLRFDRTFGPVEETKALQTQRVEPGRDPDGAPNATTRIDSYDYGGWSDLAVVAELKDGRQISGHLEAEADTSLIPLPRRSGGSLIADAWRERHKTAAADADDSEKTPAGEPGCHGDGLTLYEEYRGFMAGGRHLRTDPHKKDFLIYNACGGVARRGIALFQRLTGLSVHPQLLEDERNFDMPNEIRFGFPTNRYTAINGYFDKGPHRVNQHRVEIRSCGATVKTGGATFTQTHDLHTRPSLVDRITVEAPGAEFWRNQYGVSAADKPRQFDVAIAHELLHSVGVDHHGDDDYSLKITAFNANPQTGAAAGWYDWDGTGKFPYRFIEETTGRDVTEAWVKAALNDNRPNLEENPALGFHTANGVNRQTQELWVGRQQGEHSGDKSCIMRYWFSDIYPKPGAKQTFYLVPEGTEPVGSQLCDQRDSNLVYPVGGSKRPRYGPAHSARGRCRHWICVNDAVRPQGAAIPWTLVE